MAGDLILGERVTKIIYLSSTQAGADLLEWLRRLPCEIVVAETEGRKVVEFPPYDLGISFLYVHRIPASEFAVPYKWVNFHPGPLPEFRGRNVAYHAIMQGSRYFGATIHYMDAEFDTGEIIGISRFPIEPRHTAGDLVRIAHSKLAELFKEYVPKLLLGKVPSRPQGENGRYYRKTPIDDHLELTPDQMLKIRAITVHPKFHATATIGGKKYRIIPAEEDPAEGFHPSG